MFLKLSGENYPKFKTITHFRMINNGEGLQPMDPDDQLIYFRIHFSTKNPESQEEMILDLLCDSNVLQQVTFVQFHVLIVLSY